MRILHVLTYFRPHTSGLTIYVERLSRAQARRGHEVSVLTSRFDSALPRLEERQGVRITRVPVLLRVSKGVIMPAFGFVATRAVRCHDVIHLHLPQLDAAGVALRARLFGRPCVITYHCDLQLPAGPFNRAVNRIVDVANHLAARFTDRIVTYTSDYADSSPFLRRWRRKLEIVSPPVELPEADDGMVAAMAERRGAARSGPRIGMATRFASEKGVEVLLDALPRIGERFPGWQVLFAGQHEGVLGEQAYLRRLEPAIRAHQIDGRWVFLGVLEPASMSAFYRNIDVLVVPSLNSTESFGLVQVEAMMHGVPVVASDLPGVRQPVAMTGMGTTAAVADPGSLAAGIMEVLTNRGRYSGDAESVRRRFSPDATAEQYQGLYQEILDQRRR